MEIASPATLIVGGGGAAASSQGEAGTTAAFAYSSVLSVFASAPAFCSGGGSQLFGLQPREHEVVDG